MFLLYVYCITLNHTKVDNCKVLFRLQFIRNSTPNLVISPIVNSQPRFLGFRSDHRDRHSLIEYSF